MGFFLLSSFYMQLLIIGKKELAMSGRFLEEAQASGHTADLASMRELRFEVKDGDMSVFAGDKEVTESYDTIFLQNFYPYFSEALMLAEWAKRKGLRVIDRTFAEDNYVKSKLYDTWKLAEAGVPVPDSIQAMSMQEAEKSFANLEWPAVAKGTHGAQGRWVFKVDTIHEAKKQLKDGMVGIFVFQKFLPIEEEYRVIVIGGKVLGAMRKLEMNGDFRRNLSLGAGAEPAELSEEHRQLCITAADVLKSEFAGVDLVMAGGKPYILEVNRRPEFKGFERVTGLNVAKTFIKYVTEDRNCGSAERRKIHALPVPHKKTS